MLKKLVFKALIKQYVVILIKTNFMEDFLLWSGWAFGLISLIIAVLQYLQKEKLKKEITNIKTENYSADNGGVSVRENKGGIHVGKK